MMRMIRSWCEMDACTESTVLTTEARSRILFPTWRLWITPYLFGQKCTSSRRHGIRTGLGTADPMLFHLHVRSAQATNPGHV